jgi:Fe-S oxidoreductase
VGVIDARETIRACRYCYMCRFSCPTFLATKREAVTPRGYGLLLMMIDDGKQPWTEDILSAFYQCSLCGLGSEHCEFDWPEDDMVRHARDEIVKTKQVPEIVQNVAASLRENGVPWVESASLPMNKPNPEVLYLAGCQTRQHTPEIIAATAQVFAALGSEWCVLGNESCCGGGLYDLGYTADAKQKARDLADQIAGLNPKMVVTGCAHCYRNLKTSFPAWDIQLSTGIQVLHMAEFLDKMVEEGRLKLDGASNGESLGYHDPCMLGRKMGVYDSPRSLIEAATGLPPIELFHNKELAECCGAGAATFLVEPGVAQRVARLRLEQAAEAGAAMLVTACQNCKTIIQDAAGREGVRALDLVELVAQHLA